MGRRFSSTLGRPPRRFRSILDDLDELDGSVEQLASDSDLRSTNRHNNRDGLAESEAVEQEKNATPTARHSSNGLFRTRPSPILTFPLDENDRINSSSVDDSSAVLLLRTTSNINNNNDPLHPHSSVPQLTSSATRGGGDASAPASAAPSAVDVLPSDPCYGEHMSTSTVNINSTSSTASGSHSVHSRSHNTGAAPTKATFDRNGNTDVAPVWPQIQRQPSPRPRPPPISVNTYGAAAYPMSNLPSSFATPPSANAHIPAGAVALTMPQPILDGENEHATNSEAEASAESCKEPPSPLVPGVAARHRSLSSSSRHTTAGGAPANEPTTPRGSAVLFALDSAGVEQAGRSHSNSIATPKQRSLTSFSHPAVGPHGDINRGI